MLKVKWVGGLVEVITDVASITLNWDEAEALQELLGEARRLSYDRTSGEIEDNE
uniref:Uncharacterized protein n=1 Tax=viral metagenome TaxID=1070528 RepID=A0A6M3IEC5_9ZZZZ